MQQHIQSTIPTHSLSEKPVLILISRTVLYLFPHDCTCSTCALPSSAWNSIWSIKQADSKNTFFHFVQEDLFKSMRFDFTLKSKEATVQFRFDIKIRLRWSGHTGAAETVWPVTSGMVVSCLPLLSPCGISTYQHFPKLSRVTLKPASTQTQKKCL